MQALALSQLWSSELPFHQTVYTWWMGDCLRWSIQYLSQPTFLHGIHISHLLVWYKLVSRFKTINHQWIARNIKRKIGLHIKQLKIVPYKWSYFLSMQYPPSKSTKAVVTSILLQIAITQHFLSVLCLHRSLGINNFEITEACLWQDRCLSRHSTNRVKPSTQQKYWWRTNHWLISSILNTPTDYWGKRDRNLHAAPW